MNFVKRKVVCKMTATFWRPASREWATMGCSSAMRWLLANRRQWSASTPRWPGRPVFLWETLVSHRHTSLWVVRARALGEPLEGHKQQQHQRKHSASTNTLNNERCSHLCDQRKMLRCCKTGSKVTHRVNHLGDQKQIFLISLFVAITTLLPSNYPHFSPKFCVNKSPRVFGQICRAGKLAKWAIF